MEQQEKVKIETVLSAELSDEDIRRGAALGRRLWWLYYTGGGANVDMFFADLARGVTKRMNAAASLKDAALGIITGARLSYDLNETPEGVEMLTRVGIYGIMLTLELSKKFGENEDLVQRYLAALIDVGVRTAGFELEKGYPSLKWAAKWLDYYVKDCASLDHAADVAVGRSRFSWQPPTSLASVLYEGMKCSQVQTAYLAPVGRFAAVDNDPARRVAESGPSGEDTEAIDLFFLDEDPPGEDTKVIDLSFLDEDPDGEDTEVIDLPLPDDDESDGIDYDALALKAIEGLNLGTSSK